MNTKALSAALVSAVVVVGLVGCSAAAPPSSDVASDCAPAHEGIDTMKPGVLTLSVYTTEPYTALSSEGELGGVDGRIIQKIAEMECLTIEAVNVASAAAVSSVQSKRADALVSGLYYTADRADVLNLSDPMYRDGMSIASTEGYSTLDDLRGKKTGVIQGYLWNDALTAELGSDSVTQYQDASSMMSDLDAGRIDAVILTSAEAAFRVSENAELAAEPFTADAAIPTSTELSGVVIGMVKGNDSLTDAVNEDLATLVADGTIGEILEDEGMSAELAGTGE